MKRSRTPRWIAIGCLATFAMTALVRPSNAYAESDVFDMDLEDILALKVTSVSKREEAAGEAAAALHVVTGEDIRRSGARSLPDALRGVPGLQVSQLSGNRWAIGSRGFAGIFAEKLLVLIDGRSVYTPLFSGVFWDVQDTLLEDIDRIEIIRGPGGTLWGSNAVNGVINIVTKKTDQTLGTYATAGGGISEQAFAGVRHGGKVGRLGHWRTYAKYLQRDEFDDNGTVPGKDGTEQIRGGVRADLALGEADRVTLQGDLYSGNSYAISQGPDPTTLVSRQFLSDGDLYGGNFLTRLTHDFSDDSQGTLALYYDFASRKEALFSYRRGTFDAEIQHRFSLNDTTGITWGGDYRLHRDDSGNRPLITVDPRSRTFDQWSTFAQMDVRLLDDQLRITTGTKLEKNDFTGLEHQPNIRVAYVPTPNVTLWGAISRAARTPARGSDDAIATLSSVLPPTAPLPTEVRILGDGDLRTEDMVAYELGLRFKLGQQTLVDLATFYHRYDHVQTLNVGATLCTDGTPITGAASVIACAVGGNRLRQLITTDNDQDAQSKGFEASLRYRATDWWQLSLSYTYLHLAFDIDGNPAVVTSTFDDSQSPEHQFHVGSRVNLTDRLTADSNLYYVGPLSSLNVDAYFRLDLRLGWKVSDQIELALVGQNLIEEHEELGNQTLFLATQVPRSVFATMTWRY